MAPGGHEVIAPDMVRTLRAQADATAVIQPQPTPRSLLAGHLQGLSAPDAFHPIAARSQTAAIDHDCDSAIAIAAILAGETDDALLQQVFVRSENEAIALRAPRLTENTAGTALRDIVALDGLCRCLSSPLGA